MSTLLGSRKGIDSGTRASDTENKWFRVRQRRACKAGVADDSNPFPYNYPGKSNNVLTPAQLGIFYRLFVQPELLLFSHGGALASLGHLLQGHIGSLPRGVREFPGVLGAGEWAAFSMRYRLGDLNHA
ncbi:hypothetical protein C8R31_102495 [Nitrosospira sp. Nsp2]|uniref:hypothetical protein n=1 Tax=Nitrosospira sp. Nsp2 TaxID=136548 RepID=UPI000D30CB7E|nr:hypothetical protein [Nitrosospira sp. Nsp2]PTR16480.1 hypothetical protein C8R31_102495 [Nitrosospira sp. Nsp2]